MSTSGMRAMTSSLSVRVADADDPRLAEAVADDAAVAAGGDQRMLDAARLQDRDAAIDRIALGDAAQVDAHAGLA